jgi:hypothetical protein
MTIQFADGRPATETEFREALKELVLQSYENGVSVLGGWEVDGDGTGMDFEAVIVELDRRAD